METDDLESMIANGVTDRFGLCDCDIAGVLIQCERGNLEALVSSFTDTLASLCQIPALVGFVTDCESHTIMDTDRLALKRDSWPKSLFEKHPAIVFGLGCPDLDVVYPTHIIEGAEADESLFERHIVGDHDRGEHIVKV